jgi:hypothetical protein
MELLNIPTQTAAIAVEGLTKRYGALAAIAGPAGQARRRGSGDRRARARRSRLAGVAASVAAGSVVVVVSLGGVFEWLVAARPAVTSRSTAMASAARCV